MLPDPLPGRLPNRRIPAGQGLLVLFGQLLQMLPSSSVPGDLVFEKLFEVVGKRQANGQGLPHPKYYPPQLGKAYGKHQ